MRYASVIAVIFVGPVLSGSAQTPKQSDNDLLRGIWLEEVGQHAGKSTPGRSRLEVSDGTFKLLSKDGKRLWYRAKFKLDETVDPKQITCEVVDTGPPDEGTEVQFPGRIRGIYMVDKDTLRICWGGDPRPTAFESKTKYHFYSEFKRERK